MKKIIIILLLFILSILSIIIIIGGGIGNKTDYFSKTNKNSIVFGHRGGVSNLLVENSQEAFSKGINLGFNGIETDIRLTKDHKLIVFHDASFSKLLGIEANVNELNWDEIKSMPILFNGYKTENNILLLEEFLLEIPDSIIIYLDVKVSSFTMADYLLEVLNKVKKYDQVIIGDEDITFLSYLKFKNSSVKVVLEGFNKGKEWIHYLVPKKFKPDYYASFISEIDSNHIDFLKKNNLLQNRIAYGVNSVNITTALNLGIPHVIYDYDSLGFSINELRYKLNSIKD